MIIVPNTQPIRLLRVWPDCEEILPIIAWRITEYPIAGKLPKDWVGEPITIESNSRGYREALICADGIVIAPEIAQWDSIAQAIDSLRAELTK